MKRFIVSMMLLCAALGASAAESGKKFIELGWDIPTTDFLRDHWEQMEANAPFDGVLYDLAVTSPDGKSWSSQSLFSAEVWDASAFDSCIADLSACDFKKFQSNFIRVNFHPADIRWEDDEAWRTICDKVRICSHVLRATGGAGLAPDFESYGAALFKWNSDETPTFAEAKAFARKRGAEFIVAATEEFSDQTILCLWLNSINIHAGSSDNLDAVLASEAYGLLPAFIDGMLDALPPETTLVDGCENGYYIEGDDYARTTLDMLLLHGPAVRLVSPENRGKYRAQVQSGFGFYLDMYSNPEGSHYYRGPLENGSRMDRLERNLKAAFDAADEYVWVYGEQNRWWNVPENHATIRSWETVLPGLTYLIEKIKDPVGASLRQVQALRENGTAVNLLQNADFSQTNEEGVPQEWHFWQHENLPTGRCLVRDGECVLENVTEGCAYQAVTVESGDYYVQATVRGDLAKARLRVRWQKADGSWTRVEKDVIAAPVPLDDGSATVSTVVSVPQGAEKLAILFGASGQKGPDDFCAFDDAQLIQLR